MSNDTQKPGVVDGNYPTLDLSQVPEALEIDEPQSEPKPESESPEPKPENPEVANPFLPAQAKGDSDVPEEDFEPSSAPSELEEVPTNTLVMINNNVTLTRPASEPLKVNAVTTVSLPNSTPDELENISAKLGELLAYDRPAENNHEEAMVKMINHSMLGNVFVSSLAREASDWQQSVEIDGKTIRPSRPLFRGASNGSKLTGDDALIELDKQYGLGGHFTIPLVHSGIWVSLKPPINLEYAAIDEKLRDEKDEYGKRTLGMVFSNNKTYIVNHLMNFIDDHVLDCSLKDWDVIGLRNIIKVTDLLVLTAAISYTMYPNGFEYVSPCTASDSCDHIYNGRLKIPNCIWFDRANLTKSQKEFMSDKTTKRSLEDVQKYQSENGDINNFYDVNDALRVYFKVPTIAENIASGYRWFDDIEQSIINAFGANLERDKHNEYMNRRINLSVLRQYGHFFKTIQFRQSGNYIEDEEDINSALVRLSNVHEILDNVIEAVGKYIEDQTKALVAIPRYNCPSCGQEQKQDYDVHPALIPIDPINLFFTLGDQKNQYGSQS